MHYVYVLQSVEDGKFYIGFTTDLKRRVAEHDRGNVKATRFRRPFRLKYYEAHTSKVDAKRRERYYKTTKGKNTLKQMLREALK